MATIKDIAKLCGVSTATVSNIVNGKGGASEETKQKVLSVVNELQFSPNSFAKNLKERGSSKTIGIITEDLTVFNTPEIVDGIEEVCEKKGYCVLINNLRFYKRFHRDFYNTEQHHSRIAQELRVMMGKKIEGVVYVGCHARSLSLSAKNFRVPVVLAYSYSGDRSIPSVIFDDEQAAYDATKELIDSGHKRIGLICGNANSIHTAQRLLGYQRALFDNEILFDPSLVVPGGWESEDGYKASEHLLAKKVDAVFAMNDLLAGGVLAYAKDYNIAIGSQLSLIGFDDRDVCAAYNPPLTTVALPLAKIGKKSAEIVLEMIDDPGFHCSEEENLIKIRCSIIRRKSVVPS